MIPVKILHDQNSFYEAATMLKNVVIASLLGISMHHGLYIHGEWHLQAPIILSTHVLAFILLCAIQEYFVSSRLSSGLVEIAVLATVYFCSLLGSIGVYRLCFHRLRAFPGPRLAALSKLWHVWQCRDSRGHHVLESWHQRYGSFVRTGWYP